jgi:hypothetical protein
MVHIAAGRIRSIEKSNDIIGNQTRDLPACSIVPQPTALPLALLRLLIGTLMEMALIPVMFHALEYCNSLFN